MEDLDNVPTDAINQDTPSEEGADATHDQVGEEPEDLSDEQLSQEVERLKEEAKSQEDPKEKRHLQQQAGRLQQIEKARQKAKELEEQNKKYEELSKSQESKLVQQLIQRSVSEGITSFEELYNDDPNLAEKVAKEGWGMSAKKLIKQAYAEASKSGNEDASKKLDDEDTKAQIEHKYAVKYAKSLFSDLDGDTKKVAEQMFDDFAGKSLLDDESAESLAKMAIAYAYKDSKAGSIEKDKILGKNASTQKVPQAKSQKEEDTDKPVSFTKDEAIATFGIHKARLLYPEYFK